MIITTLALCCSVLFFFRQHMQSSMSKAENGPVLPVCMLFCGRIWQYLLPFISFLRPGSSFLLPHFLI